LDINQKIKRILGGQVIGSRIQVTDKKFNRIEASMAWVLGEQAPLSGAVSEVPAA
jgi:hypothetical protein